MTPEERYNTALKRAREEYKIASEIVADAGNHLQCATSLAERIKPILERIFGVPELCPEPKFKVGNKVTIIMDGWDKTTGTIIDVKWESFPSGFSYLLSYPHTWFSESVLEPYKEPEINTWDDLVEAGKVEFAMAKIINGHQEGGIKADAYCKTHKGSPAERKALATLKIAQLKEYYGGMVRFPQPIGHAKIVLNPDAEKFEVDIYRDWDALMTFHTREQAERFLRYNENLIRQYYMLPERKEDEK